MGGAPSAKTSAAAAASCLPRPCEAGAAAVEGQGGAEAIEGRRAAGCAGATAENAEGAGAGAAAAGAGAAATGAAEEAWGAG